MGINSFKILLTCIQFDDFITRPERWKSDRFAAFRYFLTSFNEHYAKMIVPSGFLAIDEMLYTYLAKIVIFPYNPNKPVIYGLLY